MQRRRAPACALRPNRRPPAAGRDRRGPRPAHPPSPPIRYTHSGYRYVLGLRPRPLRHLGPAVSATPRPSGSPGRTTAGRRPGPASSRWNRTTWPSRSTGTAGRIADPDRQGRHAVHALGTAVPAGLRPDVLRDLGPADAQRPARTVRSRRCRVGGRVATLHPARDPLHGGGAGRDRGRRVRRAPASPRPESPASHAPRRPPIRPQAVRARRPRGSAPSANDAERAVPCSASRRHRALAIHVPAPTNTANTAPAPAPRNRRSRADGPRHVRPAQRPAPTVAIAGTSRNSPVAGGHRTRGRMCVRPVTSSGERSLDERRVVGGRAALPRRRAARMPPGPVSDVQPPIDGATTRNDWFGSTSA